MSPWAGKKYMGTKSDSWSIPEEQMCAKGLLCWLDVAINFHNATVNNIMGQLRQSGVKTVMSLHVHDLSPWNRPAGYGYLTLGYEHAYDLIMPCSYQMAEWCHGMGVPAEKIAVVHNAGGYPLKADEIKEIVERKRLRQLETPDTLRVLFLGRFDRQKGLDRLVSIVDRSRQQSLPIEWKLVGKNILEEENIARELASISDLIEPPALTKDELNDLYEWADVLLLPSYWEGLPLTIIEAMRLGVVVCSSDVGAITEVLEHQQNGLIIDNEQKELFVNQAIALMQTLIEHPEELNRISQAAVSKASQLSWIQASKNLQKRLEVF
jgi:glycosyltransferase involved in cell wall biosynthesis